MKRDITEHVSLSDTYQRVKAEYQWLAGLLQPLQVLEWKWEEIAMDFIMGLPRTQWEEIAMDTFHNQWRSPMISKENKRKYADKEEVESTATLKKRRSSSDNNDNDGDDGDDDSSSSEEEVSSEEEPTRWARSNDGDTTNLKNNSIRNVNGSNDDDNDGSDDDDDDNDGSNNDSDNQFSDDTFD
jgi:hypothetical protein